MAHCAKRSCSLYPLGAFNDWSSVDWHRIYDYTVPVGFPRLSTIPFWMFLFWGQILRTMATVSRHPRLGLDGATEGRLRLGPQSWAGWVVGIELALALATRQLIYRLYLDPVWSWLPFALALAVYAACIRIGPGGRRLMVLIAVVGPLLEVLYIQVGGLHRYALGWLGGVPVWIALWWVLAVLIWRDLSLRLHDLVGQLVQKLGEVLLRARSATGPTGPFDG
jgi:hypothetical protein